MKYLVVAAVGDESCHHHWIKENQNFDLALIYFGNDLQRAEDYKSTASFFLQAKGNKYKLILKLYNEFEDIISTNYRYIWMPDDDVVISGIEIERFFQIAEQYGLILCQPAMKGFISHKITKPKFFSDLRFTNFVEVLAPLMEISVFIKLSKTFCLNESSFGFEFLWVKILGNPNNKIGIVDSITMIHTRPIGINYSRFIKDPFEDLKDLNNNYNLNLNLYHFKKNFITYKTIYKSINPFKLIRLIYR